MKNYLIFLTLFLSHSLFAAGRELIVFAHQNGGYPAEASCFFSNNKMTPYGSNLLVHYMCLGKEDIYGEVWFVAPGESKLIARSETGNLLSDAYVLDEKIFVLEFSEAATVALWERSPTQTKKHRLPVDYKRTHLHTLARRGNLMSFRYTTSEREHGEGVFTGGAFEKLPPRGVSFFHPIESNEKLSIQKVSRGDADEIELRLFPDFNPVSILKDRDADPTSPYLSFANYMVLQGNFWAVVATTESDKVVIIGHGQSFETKSLSRHFKTVDFWPGALSTTGEFILRATDHAGVNGLWILREVPELLLTSGEEVRVRDATVTVTAKPLFYNAPVVNKHNELFIGVGLGDSEDGPVMGQGILKQRLPVMR